jgi:hypothetical protein
MICKSFLNPHREVIRHVNYFMKQKEYTSKINTSKINTSNLILSIGYLVYELDKEYVRRVIGKFLHKLLKSLNRRFSVDVFDGTSLNSNNTKCIVCEILTDISNIRMMCFECTEFYHCTYNHMINENIREEEEEEEPRASIFIRKRDFPFKRYPVELIYSFKFRDLIKELKQKHIEYFKKHIEEELIIVTMHPNRLLRFISDDKIDFDSM